MARSIVEINKRINELQARLDALRVDFEAHRDRIRARLDALRALKARITPECEAVIVDLDTLLGE